MRINIVCAECGKELDCIFNTGKDEIEVTICPDCLEKETDEAYSQGQEDAE